MSTTVKRSNKTTKKLAENTIFSKKWPPKTSGAPGVSKLEKDAITYAARVVYEKFMVLLAGFKLDQAAQHRMLAGLAAFFSLSPDFMSELKALIAEDDKEARDKMLKKIRKKFEKLPEQLEKNQPLFAKIRQDWNLWITNSSALVTQLSTLKPQQQKNVKRKWQAIFNRVLVIDLLGFMDHPVAALNPFRMMPKHKKDDLTEETLRAQFATNAVFAMVQALTDEGLALKPSDVRKLAREFDTQISKARKQQKTAFRNNRQDFPVQSAEFIKTVLHDDVASGLGHVAKDPQLGSKPQGRVAEKVVGYKQDQPKNPTAPKSGGPSVGKVHPNAKPSPNALGGTPKKPNQDGLVQKPKPQSNKRKREDQAGSTSKRVQTKSSTAERQRTEQQINTTTITQFVTRPVPSSK